MHRVSLRIKLIVLTTGLIALTVGLSVFVSARREMRIIRDQAEAGMRRIANFIGRPRLRGRRGNPRGGTSSTGLSNRGRGRLGSNYQEILNRMVSLSTQRRGRSSAGGFPRAEVAFIVVHDIETGETEYAWNFSLKDLHRFIPENAKTPKEMIEALESLVKSGKISQDELRVVRTEQRSRHGGNVVARIHIGYSLSRLQQEVLRAQVRWIGVGIALILLGAVGAIFMANHLLRPVRSLVQAAEKVAAGDFNHQVQLSTRDELGDLTVTFNEMVRRLKDQQRTEHELTLARVFQTRLLPQTIPQFPGFEIAAKNVPSRTVSGDFYDFIPLTDDRLAVVLGDVSGKGMPAALLVAGILGLIRTESHNGGGILELIQKVNAFIYHNTATETFVTMFYSVLHLNDRVLSFCNAGHDYPLLLRSNDEQYESLKSTGGLLGIREDTNYTTAETVLGLDDLLLIYSDGVTDTFLENGRPLGKEGLLRLGRELHEENAPSLVEHIYNRVSELIGEDERTDDFTLVAIKTSSEMPSS